MPYVGRDLSRGNYLKLDDLVSQFNGSKTTFNLTSGGSAFFPGSAFSILVSLGGIVQEPESAYTINKSQITFASAPLATDEFFIIALGVALGAGVPGHGTVNDSQMAKPFVYDTYFYLDSANNRVGIHSATPTVALDVIGDIKLNGNLVTSGTGGGGFNAGVVTCTGLDVNGNADFSGNVSIGGTLTYLDVTNIDSVGIITAQSDVEFNGSGAGISSAFWDSSANEFKFKDGVKLSFGDGRDIQLSHNGSDSVISHIGSATGALKILSGGAQSIECIKAGAVNIAHNGTTKLSTTNNGAQVTGSLNLTGNITINNVAPKIFLTDTDSNSDFSIRNMHGVFGIHDQTNSIDRLTILSTGQVGISTSDPRYTLQVKGNASITSQTGTTITNGIFLDPGDTGAGNRPDIVLKGAGSSALSIKAFQVYYNNGSNESFYIDYEGNVSGKSVTIVDKIIHAGDTDTFMEFGTDTISFDTAGSEKFSINSTGTLASSGADAKLNVTNSGTDASEVTSMFYTSNSGTHNQVHIKTSTNNGGDPFIKFDAGGQDMIVGERYAGTTNNLLVLGPGLNPDTDTAIFVKGTGTVGINTTNMSSTLQIYGANDGEGTATGQITLKDTAAYNAGPTGGIVFQGHHTAGAQAIFAGIRGFKANTGDGDYDGCLGFDVRKHGAVAYEAMRIDEDGNLHVKGTNHELRFYRDDGARYGAITYTGSNLDIKNPSNDHTRVVNHGGTELASFNHDTTIDFPQGVLLLGTANTSSGHINAYENMSFNIDVDNDDTNRYFSWNKNGSSASGTEMMRLTESNDVGIGSATPATRLDVSGIISQSKIDVTQSTSSSSAVRRVFIYDTRMDSDGGAWRNSERVKATSWYNESLGTSTRGSRAEFPVVAILVLESYKLTIHDGDDPAMPMWMVFDRKNDNASTGWWDGNNSNYGTDVHCLNGYMYLTTSSAGGFSLNWISEEMRNWYVTTYSGARTGATIADRNSNTFPIRSGSDPQGGMTVSQNQQSVDMRVMDNAEIDHQTGLPQPHVLIGSANDNANMIRIIDDNFKTSLGRAGQWTATNGGCYEARWDHVHGGYWSSHGYHPETSGGYPNHGGSITYTKSIDVSGTISNSASNTRDEYIIAQGKGKDNTPPQLTGVYQHEGSHWTSACVANFWLPFPDDANPGKFHIANNGKYFGTRNGLTVASHHLEEIPQYDNTKAERDAPVRRSLHAYIAKDYATGYLFGNDKGCYGHQTSTTSLTAASNASLSSDPTFENGHGFGSIQSSATVTHNDSANTVTITSSGGSNVYAGREVTGLTSGQKYLFSVDFKRAAGSGNTGIILHNSWANTSGTQYAGSNSLPADNTWRNMSCEFEAGGTSVWLNVYAQGTIEIDNFFIVPAANYESSKAYPARGAMAYGTVTRVPVATGAELTMLSGTDNTTDFLIERNIDIDFSKDWYLMFWCPKGEGKVSIERYNSAASYSNTVAMVHMVGGAVSVRHDGSPFNSFNTPYKFACVTHRGSTNTTTLYSGPGQELQSHTGADWSSTYMADLHIGRGSYNNQYSHTSSSTLTGVSLLRYGQGLPQREHLEKIYYDELALMQPDAKCTLYGSSNAITGIAWDKSTDIVHVATSGGRSDFLGLKRINNTTANTGMLDAKNGLIVEDIT